MNAQTLSTVPHLLTANAHPIEEIERHILARQDEIELWLRQQFNRSPAPFYASYAYGVIGRLALLAAAREIEESKQI